MNRVQFKVTAYSILTIFLGILYFRYWPEPTKLTLDEIEKCEKHLMEVYNVILRPQANGLYKETQCTWVLRKLEFIEKQQTEYLKIWRNSHTNYRKRKILKS